MPRVRRIQGSGSIYFDQGRKRWVAQIKTTDPVTGRTRKRIKTAATAKAAQAKLAELQADDQPADAATTTVHAWMDWFEHTHTARMLADGEITATTAQSINVRIKRLKKIIPPKLTLAQLDTAELEAMKQRHASSTYAKATQNRDFKQLSTILDMAVYHGLLETNRVKVMRRPAVPAKPRPILTMEQASLLLDDVRGHWLEAWYVIAVPLGARCMEICGLTWDNLDLDRGTVTFTHQLVDRHGALRLSPLKGREEGDVRRAPLASWQVERLAAARQAQIVSSGRPDWVGNDMNLVVTSPRGKPMHNSHVRKDLQGRIRRLELPSITPHSFRRTACSLLLAQGVDIATVMQVMGWKSSQVPLEIYAQLTESGFDRTRDVFAAIGGHKSVGSW